MSQMVGADVAELRDLAASFDNKAAALRTIESQMSWRIHAAPWQGADVQHFQHNWNTMHRRTLLTTATAISDAAQVLRANADQQEIASDANFTGRVPSVGELGVKRTVPGWVKPAWDLFSIFVGGTDLLLDLAGGKFDKLPAPVQEFMTDKSPKIGAFRKFAIGVSGLDLVIDLAELSGQIREGNAPGILAESIDVVFDGIGFIGPLGAAADTFYDLSSWVRDNTPWGRAAGDWGADVGQAIWDWSTDTARAIGDFATSASDQAVDAVVDAVGGAARVVDEVNDVAAPVVEAVGTAVQRGLEWLNDGPKPPYWLDF